MLTSQSIYLHSFTLIEVALCHLRYGAAGTAIRTGGGESVISCGRARHRGYIHPTLQLKSVNSCASHLVRMYCTKPQEGFLDYTAAGDATFKIDCDADLKHSPATKMATTSSICSSHSQELATGK